MFPPPRDVLPCHYLLRGSKLKDPSGLLSVAAEYCICIGQSVKRHVPRQDYHYLEGWLDTTLLKEMDWPLVFVSSALRDIPPKSAVVVPIPRGHRAYFSTISDEEDSEVWLIIVTYDADSFTETITVDKKEERLLQSMIDVGSEFYHLLKGGGEDKNQSNQSFQVIYFLQEKKPQLIEPLVTRYIPRHPYCKLDIIVFLFLHEAYKVDHINSSSSVNYTAAFSVYYFASDCDSFLFGMFAVAPTLDDKEFEKRLTDFDYHASQLSQSPLYELEGITASKVKEELDAMICSMLCCTRALKRMEKRSRLNSASPRAQP
ncbi:hypothetical protein D8B26_005412 [Coccidioides posadasii str. Silveira]|uniref:Predicted protein n=1 Tax=Coccidioides posadasii (strain RMSCC 757 / Silveira) TaxID=443226 RepID=E9DJW2_COCPS|nr:predicted protein [Coccidioides posadasii str. Silveira]QVM10759.1 hypothetical protein D8B26_005412 [Coccidioides posadasii str. Silveira]